MDDKRIDKAAAFDTLFTSNRIQILKILAYYMDPRLLKGLAVYIKMSELQYTLTLFAGIRRLLCALLPLLQTKKLPLNCVMISCPCATRLRNQLFDKSHK